MKNNFLFTLMAIGLLSGCSKETVARGYELDKGKGEEVCEAYAENLRLLKPNKIQICHRRISPLLKDFSEPEFTRFYTDSKTIYPNIARFLWERDANPVYYYRPSNNEEWKGTPKQYKIAWKDYLATRKRRAGLGHKITSVDIDNDGELDEIYLDRACGNYGSIMMVLTKDRNEIDKKKTELVMQHPSRKEARWPNYVDVKEGDWAATSFVGQGYMNAPDAIHHVFYDVFSYKDKTYFDQWWNRHVDFKGRSNHEAGRLRVFRIENDTRREICSYKFNSSTK